MQPLKIRKMVGFALLAMFTTVILTSCTLVEEVIPIDESLPRMEELEGSKISFEHTKDGNTFVTSYDLGDYKLEDWKITDSKSIHFNIGVKEQAESTELLVHHVHADISIKSTDPQLNGITQDSMDNSYYGTTQDGFFISPEYMYSNIFAIEGFSEDIIAGWSFYAGGYGNGEISSKRLTEGSLLKAGSYGSQLSVVYNILVKGKDQSKYHVITLEDRIIIPTLAAIKANEEQEQAKAAESSSIPE
ncbi:hypothetical protein [Bacillus sp. FJAT-28004]|uniref:hypothetical protein n=1 Tax=Bacillus sp. FJAT-28004 TaxID=1679165 RepID=UPI0006B45A35|nr:hypothetical protein [Bacillus sp. FJAT-28004]